MPDKSKILVATLKEMRRVTAHLSFSRVSFDVFYSRGSDSWTLSIPHFMVDRMAGNFDFIVSD